MQPIRFSNEICKQARGIATRLEKNVLPRVGDDQDLSQTVKEVVFYLTQISDNDPELNISATTTAGVFGELMEGVSVLDEDASGEETKDLNLFVKHCGIPKLLQIAETEMNALNNYVNTRKAQPVTIAVSKDLQTEANNVCGELDALNHTTQDTLSQSDDPLPKTKLWSSYLGAATDALDKISQGQAFPSANHALTALKKLRRCNEMMEEQDDFDGLKKPELAEFLKKYRDVFDKAAATLEIQARKELSKAVESAPRRNERG